MGQEEHSEKGRDVLGDNIIRHSSESILKDMAAYSIQRWPASPFPPVTMGPLYGYP